jgi:hypothetical protein
MAIASGLTIAIEKGAGREQAARIGRRREE